MARIETFRRADQIPSDPNLIELDRLQDGRYQIVCSVQSGPGEVSVSPYIGPFDRETAIAEAQRLAAEKSIPVIYVQEEGA